MSTLLSPNVKGGQVSWSAQKIRLLTQCPRRYRLRYLLSHGWRPNATPEAREAYQLQLLQTEASFAGMLVHTRIRRMIAGEMAGIPRNVASESAAAGRQFANAVAQGEMIPTQNLRKGKIKFLAQHLGRKIDAASIATWQEKICYWLEAWDEMYAVADLLSSRWSILPQFLDPEQPLFSEALGAPAWIKTDLVAEDAKSNVLIIDWKTGRPSEFDRDQGAIYDIVLRDELALGNEADLTVRFVYLSYDTVRDFHFDKDDRAELKWRIAEEMGEILEAELDPSPGAFRPKPGWQCKHCPFQSICQEGSKYNESRTLGRCA